MALADVTSLQRRLREWSLQPSNERNFLRGPQQMIASALEDPRRTTQLSISGYLLGTWHLGCGQLAVLEGEMTGWDRVRLGLAFQRTSLWLRCKRRTQSRRGEGADLPVLQAANCCVMALALDDPDCEELLAAFADLPDDRFGEADAYALFVRELLALRDHRRPVVTPRLGVYGEILQLWNSDGHTLSRRMQELCELHLERTRSAPGKPAEFDEPGLMLFPAEILAIRAVRKSLDQPMPKVEHAMMFTNLVLTMPSGPWPTDPMLQRMLSLVAHNGRTSR